MKVLPGRSPVSVEVVSVLAAIIILLAFLQYRWSGQVSEAVRERMQLSLNTSITQFRQEFYRELTRICGAFRLDPSASATGDFGQVVERYDTWVRTASHPGLVSKVYVWVADDKSDSKLLGLDKSTRKLKPVSWPSELNDLRDRFDVDVPEPDRPSRRDPRLFAWRMEEEIPALFRAILYFSPQRDQQRRPAPHVAGYLVVELDKDYLQNTLVPELARRFFSGPEGLAYDVAVVDEKKPMDVIYESDPAAGKEILSSADARVSLLGEPLDDFLRVSLEREIEGREQPGRGGGRPPGFAPVIVPDFEGGRWQLVVRHRYGSLDAVVANARYRNLAISFGVLLVLAVSMGLILVSSQRAQRLAKLQMDFVAGVSHELRTPLAVICSAGDNLAEGVIDPKPQVKQYGELVRSEGRRLTGMVEQILLFASGHSGRRYDLRAVQISRVVDNVLADAEAIIKGENFSVSKQVAQNLPSVKADETALKQCLQNLINNALKYGGEGRWLGVRVEMRTDSQGPEVQVSVEDKGFGIEEADLRHIFEPFYRGKAAKAAQIHGTGLGLSLAKDMAEAMGGRISVKSAPGKGSSFTLHLPAMAGEEHSLEKTA